MPILILSVVIVALFVVIVLQRSRIIITNRTSYSLKKGISKERNATADILRLSKEVIASQDKEKEFLPNFIKYTVRSMKATGGALLLCGEDKRFYGCAISGMFPLLKEVTQQIEAQLIAHDKRHTEFIKGYKTKITSDDLDKVCGSDGYAFYQGKNPPFFPDRFVLEAPRCLIAPIKYRNENYGCIIVTSKEDFDSYKITPNDGIFLLRLAEIASLCIEVIKDFKKRQDYEKQLQAAREEGMVQVSTGIIHNIGNAVTIAKLAVSGLMEKVNFKKEERPESLILDDMLPKIQEHLKNGNLDKFLKTDKAGKQYLDIIKELLEHIRANNCEASKMVHSVSDKLFHISEIIELQQRFVGELGTENMIQLAGVVESSVTIFEESFNKRGFKITADLDRKLPEILIDSSIMTQVFINMIKNAVEAMDSENNPDKKYQIWITLKSEARGYKDYALVEIRDNGPGIPEDIKNKIFEFGFTTKMKSNSNARGIGLHFCLDSINKYCGLIEVDSKVGEGAAFKVLLPISRKNDIAPEPA
jgi:signal transduction histidine kinase